MIAYGNVIYKELTVELVNTFMDKSLLWDTEIPFVHVSNIDQYSVVEDLEIKKISNDSAKSKIRLFLYTSTTDPLFFKENRGDIQQGTWLASVNDIKNLWG